MAFDPDAYLAQSAPTQEPSFDPDAYLGIAEQPQEESLLSQAASVPLEFMAGVNQTAADIIDFLGPDQVNAVLELAGSSRRVPTLGETEFVQGATGAFMDEGLAKDIVRSAGTVSAGAIAPQQAVRGAAQQLPTLARGGESVLSGVLRQAGTETAEQAARLGAVSGAGMELGGVAGEAIGGEEGRQVGEMLGAIVLPGVAAAARAPRPTPPEVAPEVAQAREAAGQTGVELFRAQQTLTPEQLRAQRFLPELSAASKTASDALDTQNQQANRAVNQLIGSIAPDDALVKAPGQFRSAAQRAIEKADLIRKEKASPLYKQAFKQDAEVDLAPVRERAMDVMADFPTTGEVPKSISKVVQLVEGTPTLKQLHGAKLEIDQMISKVGEGSLGNTTKSKLVELKSQLLTQMDNASPSYKQARAEFAAASPRVQELEDSIVGKIANLDDTQIKSISRTIFDPTETNKSVVADAKKVIDDVDPDAWNMLLRSEMERRMGSIKPEIGVSFENVPGKLANAIFGNTRNKEALYAGMSPAQKKNAQFLETALRRASIGRPGGSETAGRLELTKQLRGKAGVIRDFIQSPVSSIVSTGDDTMFDRNVKALADVMFDPKWAPQLENALKDESGARLGYLLYQVADQSTSKLQAQGEEGQETQGQQ